VAGAARHWPDNRGIFHNDNKTALAWCNEEDHCRIISMQKVGGWVGARVCGCGWVGLRVWVLVFVCMCLSLALSLSLSLSLSVFVSVSVSVSVSASVC